MALSTCPYATSYINTTNSTTTSLCGLRFDDLVGKSYKSESYTWPVNSNFFMFSYSKTAYDLGTTCGTTDWGYSTNNTIYDLGTTCGTTDLGYDRNSTNNTILTWKSNNTGYLTYNYGSYQGSKKGLFKKRVRQNLCVFVKSRATFPFKTNGPEGAALDSLREIVTEKEFRKYLKFGFILVKGKSGDIYQIFRNESHTRVWRGGKLIEEICVRIKDQSVPKTDSVIAFKTMLETDEQYFRKLGNVYKKVA